MSRINSNEGFSTGGSWNAENGGDETVQPTRFDEGVFPVYESTGGNGFRKLFRINGDSKIYVNRGDDTLVAVDQEEEDRLVLNRLLHDTPPGIDK